MYVSAQVYITWLLSPPPSDLTSHKCWCILRVSVSAWGLRRNRALLGFSVYPVRWFPEPSASLRVSLRASQRETWGPLACAPFQVKETKVLLPLEQLVSCSYHMVGASKPNTDQKSTTSSAERLNNRQFQAFKFKHFKFKFTESNLLYSWRPYSKWENNFI